MLDRDSNDDGGGDFRDTKFPGPCNTRFPFPSSRRPRRETLPAAASPFVAPRARQSTEKPGGFRRRRGYLARLETAMRFLLLLLLSALIACSWTGVEAGSVEGQRPVSRTRREPLLDVQPSPKGLDLSLDAWHSVPPYLRQVLTAIDDRLRGLDAFGSALRLTRIDFSLEQTLRKLDALDSRLGRLEAKMDLRLESDAFSQSRKDSVAQGNDEHLSRRLEAVADKLNNKMSFLETKLDMRADRLTNKLELMERDLQDSSEDALEKIARGDESRARLQSDVSKILDSLDKMDASQRQMDTVIRADVSDVIKRSDAKMDLFSHEILTVASLLRAIQTDATRTSAACRSGPESPSWEQVTNLTDLVEKMLRAGTEQFNEIDADVESYTRKVINGIHGLHELRRTTDDFVRGAFQDTVAQGNRTRVMVREEFRKLHEQIEPLPLIEPRLSLLSEGLERKISELSATVDHSFATLLVAQNSFISSCHRIQEEEIQLYDLLERIIHEMRNRSQGDTQRISDQLQGHSDHVAALLRGAVNAVFAAGNSTLDEVRRLVSEPCSRQPCLKAATNVSTNASTPTMPSTRPVTGRSATVPLQRTLARTSVNGTAEYEYYDDVK
ncbi:uncharacterized protein LOC115323762 [Ixodes scapularis]|uniref:uncharacterized protein LOC115323762 n=1 Tax=Ixodes scapularis TaxID=6945 RepID=UPI001C37E729|nr:uncharacterized protein LOC115323762 [Ixodes scapularis]